MIFLRSYKAFDPITKSTEIPILIQMIKNQQFNTKHFF
jgi:hypothetical protein